VRRPPQSRRPSPTPVTAVFHMMPHCCPLRASAFVCQYSCELNSTVNAPVAPHRQRRCCTTLATRPVILVAGLKDDPIRRSFASRPADAGRSVFGRVPALCTLCKHGIAILMCRALRHRWPPGGCAFLGKVLPTSVFSATPPSLMRPGLSIC